MTLTLGTDPEYVILNETGKPVPAHRFFPAKTAKMMLLPPAGPNLPPNAQAFRDGYAVELNVVPGQCREALTHRVIAALSALQQKLPVGHRLASLAAWQIDLENDLKDAPDDVLTFGCDPSWSAYTGDSGVVPLDAASHPYRYGGGHLHLAMHYASIKDSPAVKGVYGWLQNADDVCLYVRMLDRYLGVPLTYWFDRKETFQRRQYYGRAGEFRYQQYGENPANGDPLYLGVEYRVPGPEVWNAPPVASFALGVMRAVAQQFTVLKTKWDSGVELDVAGAINTGAGLARLLVDSPFTTKAAFLKVVDTFKRPFQELKLYNPTLGMNARGWDYIRGVGTLEKTGLL